MDGAAIKGLDRWGGGGGCEIRFCLLVEVKAVKYIFSTEVMVVEVMG
jgi:hypothetical protein